MPRQLSDADLEEFTPAEIEALRTTSADETAAPAAEADDAQPEAAASTETAADAKPEQPADPADSPAAKDEAPKAGEGDTQDETSTTAQADPDALAEVLAESQPADAPRYELPDTASIAEQRKALREQRAALDAKWLAGDLSDADRAQKVSTIEDQLDELLQRATRAETLAEVNRQNAINDQARVIDAIRRDGAKAGIDYKPDGDAAAQFDTALQLVAARKGMAGKPFEDLAQQAHRMVLALHGKLSPVPSASPPPAAAPAAAPAPKPPREIPPTLGHMPAAARAPIANDFMSEFAGIDDPDRAEEMLANMPARQREALLRATVKVQ